MRSIYQNYIIANGKKYVPALLPDDLDRGEMHQCFDNSIIRVINSKKYKYVEGFAYHPITYKKYYHAWLTDGIHAFDVTWRAEKDTGENVPLPFIYIGIEFETNDIIEFMVKTGYKGIYENEWRFPNYLKKINKI